MCWKDPVIFKNKIYFAYSAYAYNQDFKLRFGKYKWGYLDSIVPYPDKQASNITIHYKTNSETIINWKEGNGNSKLLVACEGDSVPAVTNGISYNDVQSVGSNCYGIYKTRHYCNYSYPT